MCLLCKKGPDRLALSVPGSARLLVIHTGNWFSGVPGRTARRTGAPERNKIRPARPARQGRPPYHIYTISYMSYVFDIILFHLFSKWLVFHIVSLSSWFSACLFIHCHYFLFFNFTIKLPWLGSCLLHDTTLSWLCAHVLISLWIAPYPVITLHFL